MNTATNMIHRIHVHIIDATMFYYLVDSFCGNVDMLKAFKHMKENCYGLKISNIKQLNLVVWRDSPGKTVLQNFLSTPSSRLVSGAIDL